MNENGQKRRKKHFEKRPENHQKTTKKTMTSRGCNIFVKS